MEPKKSWLWGKPLLVIAVASFVAAMYVFKGDIPREVVIVTLIIAVVGASKVLRQT